MSPGRRARRGMGWSQKKAAKELHMGICDIQRLEGGDASFEEVYDYMFRLEAPIGELSRLVRRLRRGAA